MSDFVWSYEEYRRMHEEAEMRDRMSLIEKDAFRVLGVDEDIEKVAPGFMDVWGRFSSHAGEITPLSVDGAHYGMFYDSGGDGRYLAGMAVAANTPAPEGVIALDIAAATYAVFQTTLGDIGSEDFATWLPTEGLESDASKPQFDFHPPGTTEAFNRGEDPAISVWIPAWRK